ncbi:MAG: glycosyltransferase, partial [Candidatus Caldarchaeum sp.]
PRFEHDYKAFVAKANNLEAHIGIAPLEVNEFNMSKSYIKFLEYSCMGIAGIYSRVSPYAEQVRPGIDGLMASTTNEWIDALITLIQDDQLRHQIVMSAQVKLQEFLLSKAASKWLSQVVAAIESSRNTNRPHFRRRLSDLLGALNEAWSDYLLELKRQREAAEAATEHERRQREAAEAAAEHERRQREAAEAAAEHERRQREAAEAAAEHERRQREELEWEIVSYATSWSWKITRPLRWLGKRVFAIPGSPPAK